MRYADIRNFIAIYNYASLSGNSYIAQKLARKYIFEKNSLIFSYLIRRHFNSQAFHKTTLICNNYEYPYAYIQVTLDYEDQMVNLELN